MRPTSMISAMPTVTNVRLVSRNLRVAYPVRRCISTSPSPQPPAFVFDIVSASGASRVDVERLTIVVTKDGVLLRGETVLEPTRNAFRILHGDNPFNR